MRDEHLTYLDNKYLNQAEFHLARIFLDSMPRYLTMVLGNGCNIDCRHCYQLKNGDNLLHDMELGIDLRRELTAFYPYLSTFRIQGGEVFALRGFQSLLEDVRAFVRRPLVSISTNGTLIDGAWALRLVELPLQSLTISLDAATATTYERIRRGANFEQVIANIRRLQQLKADRGSTYPLVDAFFVVMRSNFREIPQFLELLKDLDIKRVSFQMTLVDQRNREREPDLDAAEVFREPGEIQELHGILKDVMRRQSVWFHSVAWSGMQDLFSAHGLSAGFLREQTCTLIPDQNSPQAPESASVNSHAYLIPPDTHPELGEFPAADIEGAPGCGSCPNPWATMFITENGDVSLCFLSGPVGNLYQTPLVEIWNGSAALAKRSNMAAGRYLASGCSALWCHWREGASSPAVQRESWRALLRLTATVVDRMKARQCQLSAAAFGQGNARSGLQAVRRVLRERDTRIRELEAVLVDLWEKNGVLHTAGQRHIDHLERRVKELERLLEQNTSPV